MLESRDFRRVEDLKLRDLCRDRRDAEVNCYVKIEFACFCISVMKVGGEWKGGGGREVVEKKSAK